MKKVSTAVTKQDRTFSQPTRTIGLDLGDRNSWYCVVDEAGRIQVGQRVRTTAKALREAFSGMPLGRIAWETGTGGWPISAFQPFPTLCDNVAPPNALFVGWKTRTMTH